VGFFATRVKPAAPAHPEARAELSADLLAALPPRFEAVGEALASGSAAADECAVAGEVCASDGLSLDEALADLSITCRVVGRPEPRFVDVRAVSVAWSETTLDYLHRLTCADPSTGLASLAHLQERLAELHRMSAEAPRAGVRHALVVVDLTSPRSGRQRALTEALASDLRLAAVARIAGTVFGATATIGRLGPERLVVITARDGRLGRRVWLLRSMVTRFEPADAGVRIWIEGLPDSGSGAATVLAELARS